MEQLGEMADEVFFLLSIFFLSQPLHYICLQYIIWSNPFKWGLDINQINESYFPAYSFLIFRPTSWAPRLFSHLNRFHLYTYQLLPSPKTKSSSFMLYRFCIRTKCYSALNSSKYGNFRAYIADILFLGLNSNILSSKQQRSGHKSPYSRIQLQVFLFTFPGIIF